MAKAHQELTDLEAQAKEVSSGFKAKIETAKSALNRESSIYRQGYEYRDVEVSWKLNTPVNGKKTFVRHDCPSAWPGDAVPEVTFMTQGDSQSDLGLPI